MLLATKFSSVSLRMYDVGTLIFRPNNFFGQNLSDTETALLCVTHDSSQKKSPLTPCTSVNSSLLMMLMILIC